jgi:hypothetical protein
MEDLDPDDVSEPSGLFQVSEEPVVPRQIAAESADDLPASYGTDLLYVIARDPHTLFLYWDLDWRQRFAEGGLSPRQIHLRTYREDGTVEGTREVNPFRGHAYVEVAAPGAIYFCELGCFAEEKWKSLARSGSAATPLAEVSDDLSATFATLPLHLSFQRMLEIFRASADDSATLANSIAKLQDQARLLQERIAPEEWSRMVDATAVSLGSANGNAVEPSELSALLDAAREPLSILPPAARETLWRRLTHSFAGSSDILFGGSSHFIA